MQEKRQTFFPTFLIHDISSMQGNLYGLQYIRWVQCQFWLYQNTLLIRGISTMRSEI